MTESETDREKIARLLTAVRKVIEKHDNGQLANEPNDSLAIEELRDAIDMFLCPKCFGKREISYRYSPHDAKEFQVCPECGGRGW